MSETDILTFDKLLLSFTAVIQRPRNNSLQFFDSLAALLADREYSIPMDGYNRCTLRLVAREEKIIELIINNTANFLFFVTTDKVALDLADKNSTGFGENIFGFNGFGGTGLGTNLDSGINGIFAVQGRFTDLKLKNLTDNDVRIDLIAIKFKEA